MKLRRAEPDEATWINERYAAVRFIPSDLTRETVIVAEIGGAPAGLGRLVPIDAESCELGGMLVFDDYRGRGVARAIIDELLRHAEGRKVYCLPFAELEGLYRSAGFERAENAPAAMMEKLDWCRVTYEREVLLLVTT
jgi:GNAT superfamily N-acetyltransferase